MASLTVPRPYGNMTLVDGVLYVLCPNSEGTFWEAVSATTMEKKNGTLRCESLFQRR